MVADLIVIGLAIALQPFRVSAFILILSSKDGTLSEPRPTKSSPNATAVSMLASVRHERCPACLGNPTRQAEVRRSAS